jgi:hypothetical protein
MRQLFGTIFAALVLTIGVLPTWAAGTLHVSGEVSGIWPADWIVTVDGPIRVSAEKSLVIEPGVRIMFKTLAPIQVFGDIDAQGTEGSPIVILPLEGWAGFDFEGYRPISRVLRNVVIGTDFGIPNYVVRGNNSQIRVEDCDFTAHYSCLSAAGGRIWATRNHIQTDYLFSKAIEINQLLNDATGGCQDEATNQISDNIVKVVVPFEVVGINEPRFTAGLSVDGSTNACFYGNVISVTAPGTAVGVFFGRHDDFGGRLWWTLDYCVVTVRGTGLFACGVENANDGTVNVIRCSFDIGGASMGYDPIGILVTSGASALVNSSLVEVSRGASYFMTSSGGAIAVDYSDTWLNSSGAVPPADPPGGGDNAAKDMSAASVVLGPHMYSADPHLLMQGDWGAWMTLDDAQAYYGLMYPSPCIDRGDTTYAGWDPDHTLPDIGRYYFAQNISGIGGGPQPAVLPTTISLSPIYPNPFNATTMVPFMVGKNGMVRIVVYDILGREVSVLRSGQVVAGSYQIPFSGLDLPSGLYIVSMEFNGSRIDSRPAMLLK